MRMVLYEELLDCKVNGDGLSQHGVKCIMF